MIVVYLFCKMQIHRDIDNLPAFRNAVITIDTFDGVHMGHRQIIEKLRSEAQKNDGESVIITFHPHPRKVVSSAILGIRLLNTPAEKAELMEQLGIDHLVIVPFSDVFANMSAEEYIEEFLIKKFHPHTIIIGYDHRFGRNREGDIHLLRQLGEAYDFGVEEIPAHEIDHVKVSSTKVREALLRGEAKLAHDLLGYAYPLGGVVVKGDQRGRTIGFPTANVGGIDPGKLLPADGVYAVEVDLRDGVYKGMLNIGLRPTVEGRDRTVEVNIFDLDRDLYGEPITVRLRHRLRAEVRFSGLDALKAQLLLDRELAEKLLA